MKKLSLLILALLLWTAPAWATTRYVDSTAGACSGTYSIANRNCSGSNGTSYATISAATAASSAGDVIYLRAGVYTTAINTNGKAGTSTSNMIYMGTYPGDAARGAIIRVSGAVRSLNDVTTMNFWQFDNLTWDGVNGTEGSSGIAFTGTPLKHDVWFTNSEFKNFKYSGLYLEGDNHKVLNNLIHDSVSSNCIAPNRWYGIYYAHGSNGVIDGNEIYNQPAGGIQMYPGVEGGSGVALNGNIIRNNKIHNNNTVANSCNGVGFSSMLLSGTGIQVYRNSIYDNGPTSPAAQIDVIRLYTNTADSMVIVHNTFSGNKASSDGYGIRILSAAQTNNVIKNNHMPNSSNTWLSSLGDLGTGTLTATNRTTGVITDCTNTPPDFTQKPSSSCIDAGTILTGYSSQIIAYNGSAPDIGAYESVASAATATIANAAMDVTLSMGLNVPLLPATGITGFTVHCTGTGCGTPVISSAARLSGADSVVRLSLTGIGGGNVCAAGQTWTVDYAPGNVTDSVGQPLASFTGTAVTNSCAGATGGPTFTPVASSTFTGADENPLCETSGGGCMWAVNNSGSGSFKRVSNVASPTDGSTDSGARYIGSSFNAAQYSRGKIYVGTSNGGGAGVGLSVCASSSARTYYRFTIDHAASNNLEIRRFVNETSTRLGALVTQAFTDADQFTLAVENEIVYVYDSTNTLITSRSDVGGGVNCTTGSSFPGVQHSSTTTSATSKVDNWEGGNFSSTSTPPPPPVGTFTQTAYRFYRADLVNGIVTPLAALNTGITILPGVSFAITTQTDCTTADCVPFAERLRYSRNGGSYLPIPTTCGADAICFYGSTGDPLILSGTVTCCLSGALTANNGTTQLTSDAVPVVDLTLNSSVVQRRVLRLGATAIPTDTYDLREYNQDGSVLNTYTVTARVTVDTPPVPTPATIRQTGPASNSIVSLVWPPSALPNLAGYNIYQSNTSGVYASTPTHTITLAGAASHQSPATQWTTVLPVAGTYYFTFTAFDTGGNESAKSNEVTVVVTGFVPRTAR